ncbi:AraC family transcriptional regulator [Pedobacter suwonensis]|uniref:AraC family transcriptional regulator n=1 Tax=Pedobacter suwonensis TaxID=332999 RepID=UPI0036B98F80
MSDVEQYYLTGVDKFKETVYCLHDRIGENEIPDHAHEKGQLIYTEGGLVYITTPDKTFFLPARHYMWIPPLLSHSIHPGSEHVVMRNLYFPVSVNDESFFFTVGIYPVNDLLFEMINFTKRWSGDVDTKDKCAVFFTFAIKELLPKISSYKLLLALPYSNDKRLKEVVDYMGGNLGQEISFPGIAGKFGFSERSLSRLFRYNLGMSFIQYLTIQRMMCALQLLLQDNCAIKEISGLVGYSSVPTFSNTFYKITGFRPSEYVKFSRKSSQ